ncbi:MAG TPA: helix-turn-helix domain-containing protein [Candidatus Deferrimicrobium sp.]|nr:helix-turn-helix domain-containing protein [Candidatus Deferrimicrobium sp.]
MTIGKTLRESRESQGLTLKDLEETTKIRTHYLQALEEEAYSELPGQTYVMGFIRTYARSLGLDPQELVDNYKAAHKEPENVIQPIDPIAPPITKKPFPLQRVVIISGLCLLALLTLYGMDKVWSDKAPAPKVEQAVKAPAVNKPENTPPQTQPQPTQTPTPEQPTNQLPAQSLALDIVFSDKCWLIIKADGQEVFQGTLQAGQTKTITAKDTIEFPSIGNAGALQLTLNGKPLASLGGRGVVVKNKTLTKNDIPS